jgi:vacuolar-type H+-ATPase subunit I/STV1
MIEEQNKNIEAEIQRHEELGDMTDKEKEVVRQKLSQQIDEMDNQMKEKDLQIKNIEQQMITIKQFVHSMCDNFKRSHFFLSVAQNAQYDEDTQFNENNVISYLAELEEYISLFITYLAYKQENPDAAISSLSLEKMAIKEFDKDKLIIDAPNSNDIGMMNDDMETEDEITVDPRQLYKRFEDMWKREDGMP